MKFIKSSVLLLWYVVAAAIILFAVLGVLVNVLTPILNDHKGLVEAQLSRLMHQELSIGSIDAHWARFGPIVAFHDVTVLDGDKTVLRAETLTAHLGMYRTVIKRKPYFQSLRLSGATIDIHQLDKNTVEINAAKTLHIGHGQESSGSPGWLAWLIWQHHLKLNDITVNVQPLEGESISLKLAELEFSKEQQSPQMFAKVYLRAWQQQPITASVRFTGALSAPDQLIIEGYLHGQQLNLRQLSQHLPLPIAFNSGSADMQCWFSMAGGQLQSVQSMIDIRQAELARLDHRFMVQQASGHLAWSPQSSGWQIVGDQLHIVAEGHQWQTTAFQYQHRDAQDHLKVSYFDLGELSLALGLLDGLPDAVVSTLHGLNPKGEVDHFYLKIPKDKTQVNLYQAAGHVNHVHLQAYQHVPGVSELSGDFIGTTESGQFDVALSGGSIDVPNYFDQAIALTSAKVGGIWQQNDRHVEVWLNQIELANEAASAAATLRLTVPLAESESTEGPWMSLVGEYTLVDGRHVADYLPVNTMSPAVKAWLNTAFVGGKRGQGVALFRGRLNEFPYKSAQGTFIIDSVIDDLDLQFSDSWPVIQNLQGTLRIDGAALTAKIDHAVTQAIDLHEASVTLPDFTSVHSVLKVMGRTNETAANALAYIQSSPLKSSVGEWLTPFSISGSLAANLNISVPLRDITREPTVEGEVVFDHNQVQLPDWRVMLQKLTGKLTFDNNSIAASHLQATLGNNPINIDINTLNDSHSGGVINVLFEGKIGASDLATIADNELLNHCLSGVSHYQGYALIPFDQQKTAFQLSFKSSLEGMSVALPSPLNKTTSQSRLLSMDYSSKQDKLPAKIELTYGDVLQSTAYYAAKTKAAPASLSITANMSEFNYPIDLPSSGGSSGGSWLELVHHLTLKTPKFSFYNTPLTAFFMTMDANDKAGMTINMRSDQLKGRVELPDHYQTNGINANFDYLILSTGKAGADQANASTSQTDLAHIPPLTVLIDRVTLNRQFYGQVTLKTSPLNHGVNIDQLTTRSSVLNSESSGQWVSEKGSVATSLKGQVTTDNLGDAAKSLGISSNVVAKKAALNFNLNWPAAPYQFQLEKLRGTASMSVANGVIPVDSDSVAMGLGKVLSLFSVQSIKRRLKLDFSDLSDEGYSYNKMKANVTVGDGIANFSDSYFDGPQAKIAFNGPINLTQKTYGNTLVVTPYVTSTLPLIATLAGGPVAGVATYAVDKLVGSSVKDFTSYTYYLQGTWANPSLTNAATEQSKESSVPVVSSTPVKKGAVTGGR